PAVQVVIAFSWALEPAPDKLPEKHSRSAGTSGAALSGTALSLPPAVEASNRPGNAAEAAPRPLRRRRLRARLRTVDGSTTASIPFVGGGVRRGGHGGAPVSGASSQGTEYRRKFRHLWSTTPSVPPWGTTRIEKVGGVHDTRSGWARVLGDESKQRPCSHRADVGLPCATASRI